MATLSERITARITELTDERAQLVTQHETALAGLDTQIAALSKASAAITKEVETAYAALVQLGLIRAVEERR